MKQANVELVTLPQVLVNGLNLFEEAAFFELFVVEDLLEDFLVSPPQEAIQALVEHLVLLEIEEQLPVELDGIEEVRREEHIAIL